jgi:two-component system, sensor histidine kinase and response regulator
VEILSNGPQPPFDLVLMDLQMPEMDGYQATAKLRGDARFATLPIIAMTAHATIEERQRCLAVGMNDHISKPIDPAMLFETVGRFYKPANQTSTLAVAQPPPPSPPAEAGDSLLSVPELDTRDGLSRVAGNRKLYLKLLRQFMEQQGPVPGKISDALRHGDVALAERLAHTIKGVAGNIGARSVQGAAGALEKLIRDRARPEEVERSRREVAAVLERLLAGLQTALRPPEPSAPDQSPTPPVPPAQSREAAEQLAKLLSEFDPGAADFIEANQAALRPLFAGESWQQFEQNVQGYSFADAQAQLEEALKSVPVA